jgi:hypothetical protein
MKKVEITVPHALPKDEALKRIKHLVSESSRQFAKHIDSPQEAWDDYCGDLSFFATNLPISATVSIIHDRITLVTELPFPISLMKERIVSAVEIRIQEVLR